MGPLTNLGAVLGFYGDLPGPASKVPLPVVHYGSVVIRDSKTVDAAVAVLSKVVLAVWREKYKRWMLIRVKFYLKLSNAIESFNNFFLSFG